MDGIIRTIKGNSFEICRKEMERCKDTGSLKPENIDKKQVVKGVSKMKETKTTVKGMVKRGLVLCMIGVMALGMVACGGKDKKSTSTQPKTKTESSKSTVKKSTTKRQEDKKADDTKTDYDQEEQNDVTAPDQNKTDEGQNQGNAATGQQDTKEDGEKGATTSKKSDKNKKSIGTSRNNSTRDKKTN